VAATPVPSRLLVVCTEYDCGFLARATVDGILLETFGGVKVEDKQERSLLIDQDLVSIVLSAYVLITITDEIVVEIQADHELLKLEKIVIAQVGAVSEVPSPTAVVVAPVVALPRKINPFRVSEFVAHEGQIALVPQCEGQ
jgi:hypothetical protein